MEKGKSSLRSRWREKRQEKKVRTGPTPEKLAEGGRRADPTVRDAAEKVGIRGFIGGWF